MERLNDENSPDVPSSEPGARRLTAFLTATLLGVVACQNSEDSGNETGSATESGACMNATEPAEPAAYVANSSFDIVNDVVALAEGDNLVPLFNGSVPGIAPVEFFTNPNCTDVNLGGAAAVFPADFNGNATEQRLLSFTVDDSGGIKLGEMGLPENKIFFDPDFEVVKGSDFLNALPNANLPTEATDLIRQDEIVVMTVLGSTLPGDPNPSLGINFLVSKDGSKWIDTGVQLTPYVEMGKSFNDPSLVSSDEGMRVFWQTLPSGEVLSAPLNDVVNPVETPGLNGSPSALDAGSELRVYAPGEDGLNFVTVESFEDLGEENRVDTHPLTIPTGYLNFIGDPSLSDPDSGVVKLRGTGSAE